MATEARALLIALAMSACSPERGSGSQIGDPDAGRRIVQRIDCGVCHVIPGVPGARGTLGPSLAGFARRELLAGIAPKRPDLLVRWVQDAPSIAPQTAMPPMPLTASEARDVVAFLGTLH
jgi:mono/diheme cytochrome c family protein